MGRAIRLPTRGVACTCPLARDVTIKKTPASGHAGQRAADGCLYEVIPVRFRESNAAHGRLPPAKRFLLERNFFTNQRPRHAYWLRNSESRAIRFPLAISIAFFSALGKVEIFVSSACIAFLKTFVEMYLVMKKALTICLALSLVAGAVAVAAELKSGLEPGKLIGPFDVVKCAGPDDNVKVGAELCYRCKYGGARW